MSGALGWLCVQFGHIGFAPLQPEAAGQLVGPELRLVDTEDAGSTPYSIQCRSRARVKVLKLDVWECSAAKVLRACADSLEELVLSTSAGNVREPELTSSGEGARSLPKLRRLTLRRLPGVSLAPLVVLFAAPMVGILSLGMSGLGAFFSAAPITPDCIRCPTLHTLAVPSSWSGDGVRVVRQVRPRFETLAVPDVPERLMDMVTQSSHARDDSASLWLGISLCTRYVYVLFGRNVNGRSRLGAWALQDSGF